MYKRQLLLNICLPHHSARERCQSQVLLNYNSQAIIIHPYPSFRWGDEVFPTLQSTQRWRFQISLDGHVRASSQLLHPGSANHFSHPGVFYMVPSSPANNSHGVWRGWEVYPYSSQGQRIRKPSIDCFTKPCTVPI